VFSSNHYELMVQNESNELLIDVHPQSYALGSKHGIWMYMVYACVCSPIPEWESKRHGSKRLHTMD
jgi:hypothetical protein